MFQIKLNEKIYKALIFELTYVGRDSAMQRQYGTLIEYYSKNKKEEDEQLDELERKKRRIGLPTVWGGRRQKRTKKNNKKGSKKSTKKVYRKKSTKKIYKKKIKIM